MTAIRDGLLLLNKPTGPTSHDLVSQVRRAAGIRRVGHAGTLDPMAAGLLPLVIGRATRLVRFLPNSPKGYEGTLRLGRTTDTDDVTGAVLSLHGGPLPSTDAVLTAALALEGRHPQVPPAYSARKVKGRRLYELARQGVEVERRATEVEIHRFALAATDQPDVYSFAAEVSSGTYIRAMARDLGEALGCGGTLASLKRTRIGPMRLEDALDVPHDGLDRTGILNALIPPERMPLAPPPYRLTDPELARKFTLGAAVPGNGEAGADGLLSVLNPSGMLLGVAEGRSGLLHPRVVLNRD